MSIGARIKELRIRKRESLQQLADAVGASKPHIWELEVEKSKNPSVDLLKKIAEHFNVPVSHLLEEQPSADTRIFGREFQGLSEADKKLFWDMAERLTRKDPNG
jgi:transcriptional regulator with XRE-family HTH domain